MTTGLNGSILLETPLVKIHNIELPYIVPFISIYAPYALKWYNIGGLIAYDLISKPFLAPFKIDSFHLLTLMLLILK